MAKFSCYICYTDKYFIRNKMLIRRQTDSIPVSSASCAAAFLTQFQKIT